MTAAECRGRLRGLLKQAAAHTQIEIDCAYEADELLRLCAGIDREQILLNGETVLSDETANRILMIAEQRKTGEPLGYLIGYSPFRGRNFAVALGQDRCLIPRADTEIVVQLLCDRLQKGDAFLDLCCGSGCIALSALAETIETTAVAVEKSPGAFRIAQENAARMGMAARFSVLCGDVLCGDVLCGDVPDTDKKYACIVSNPPYIPTDDLSVLDCQVRQEPRMALDGGADGLLFYRAILAQYHKYLMPDGAFLFEIGYQQADALRSLATACGFSCRIFQDFAGHDRACVLERKT